MIIAYIGTLFAISISVILIDPALAQSRSCSFAAPATAHDFIDGCSGASAGSPQYPNLLSKYGSKRPIWDVAGVDYHVGIPAGTTLTDWQKIDDPNLSVNTSTGMIRCTGVGASVTLDEIDFSLHNGAYIYNGAEGCAAITISNSNFACPTAAPSFVFIQDQNNAAYIVKYNNFNGASCWASNGPAGGFQAFLSVSRAIVQYNWFINSSEQVLDASPPGPFDYRYNLLDNMVIAPGAHMNYQQFTAGGTVSGDLVAFNTSYQTSCGGAEGYQFYNNNRLAITINPVLENNTMIARPPESRCATPNNNVVMSYMVHGTSGGQYPTMISGNGINEFNYFDESGAYGAYYPGTMIGWTNSGNINMTTGAAITPR